MSDVERYPIDVLQEGEEFLEHVGNVALRHERTVERLSESGESQAAFRVFTNPEVSIDPFIQLSFMSTVLNLLGEEVPDNLTGKQYDNLRDAARSKPRQRLMPVVLQDFPERQLMSHNGRKLPGQDFDPIESAMRLPDDGTIYRKLSANLSATVTDETGNDYFMGYKSPHTPGVVLPRPDFIAALLDAEQAVEFKGKAWGFVLMDVQVNAPRVAEEAGELYKRINPIAVPESLVLTQIVHQGAGTPNQTGAIDFGNEAVFLKLKEGIAEDPSYISTVRWRTDWKRIGTYARQFASVRDYMGVREATSAL